MKSLFAASALLCLVTDGACLSDAASPPPASSPVAATGPMRTIRAAHTATLLRDGRVLVAGGCTLASCERGAGSQSTELYDPSTGRFADGPRMHGERSGGHAAVELQDGRVLLAGGWGASPTASAEVYDPATGSMREVAPLAVARADAAVVVLTDGRVLFAGGFDGSRPMAESEIFDPTTNRFTPIAGMNVARAGGMAVRLPNGRVLIAGGSAGRGQVLASAEVFDPQTERFTPVADMAAPRHKHAAVALDDGRVLVIGGSDARDGFGRYRSAEYFDVRTNAFSAAPSMSSPRYKISTAVTALGSGRVFVGGGAIQPEIFDLSRKAFDVVDGDLGAARAFSTATRLANGDVLITGGYDERIQLTRGAWLFRAH